MRDDLSSEFLVKMASNQRTPIQLLVIHFQTIGDIFLSDRDIVVNGQFYTGIIEDWGELGTVGEERAASGTMTNSLSIWNGGDSPFSDYFLQEDPVDVFVDLYQTFEGLAPEDMAHIGEFVIQDPIEYAEASSLLKLEIVTSNMRYFGQVGELLTREKFPYALESDLNKSIDLIVGDAGRVRCLCSDKPPITTIDRSILRTTITIEVSDDLDEKGFAQSGRIQINGELINYSSRGQFYIVASQRGYNSLATDHTSGSEVIQSNKTVDYIIGQLPIQSISEIWVKGKTAQETPQFIQDAENNVGLLRFSKQPVYQDLSPVKDATVYFDTTDDKDTDDVKNTALTPYYAYAVDYKSDGAIINSEHTTLAISNQNDLIASRAEGEIVNVFLNITAWATLAYLAERVDVWVDGLGTIGRLTRPNEAASMNIVADVDIDHPHEHVDGGIHSHDKVDADYKTTENIKGHFHDMTVSAQASAYLEPISITQEIPTFSYVYRYYNFSASGLSKIGINPTIFFYLDGQEGSQGADLYFIKVHISFNGAPYVYYKLYEPRTSFVGLYVFNYSNWENFYEDNDIRIRVEIYAKDLGTESSDLTVSNVSMEYSSLYKKTDNQNIYPNTSLENPLAINNQNIDTFGKPIKDKDDVDELLVDNRDININTEETNSYTQSFTDSFDLLDYKSDIDWGWLHQRKIRLIFVGTGAVEIYVTWVDFSVEYRKPILKTTDEVSCKPIGMTTNRPDSVVQYLLEEKAGVPLDKFGSVYRNIPKWDDTETWDDNEIWQDEGQVENVPPGAAFEEAAAWFAYHNYFIDGVIPGNLTIKDAIQELTWQTRSKLFWQNGKVQLTIQRKSDAWNIAKNITTDDIQLRSFEAFRSNVDEIVNKIDLFHTVDRLSDAEGSGMYNDSFSVSDNQSIIKHGDRAKDDLWLFSLVRNSVMAESIADYYLWALGETTTYYKFATYLNNFDIEKDDYITINSQRFSHLLKLPVVIRELIREFGSGKINKINLLRIVAQSIRHYFHMITEESFVYVSDALNIEFGFDLEFNETVGVEDVLEFIWTKNFEETLTTSDVLEIIAQYNQQLTEEVSVNSDLSSSMNIAIEDSIFVDDSLDVAQELCFGACGFGAPNCEIPFGSRTAHQDAPTEHLQFLDVLCAAMGVGLSEEVTITDELLFSDGFGCPAGLGSGMGLSPFGC